jgi:acyl carrier protein
LKSREEIELAVDNILVKLLEVESGGVALATRENTTSWSSLVHIEVFFALEEEFDLRFADDEMAFAESRNDLVEIVLAALMK